MAPPPASREFDVVVFGATGFTGQLACEYLNETLGLAKVHDAVKKDKRVYQNDRDFHHINTGYAKKLSDVKWAIAGRDREKLEKMKEKLPNCAGIIFADSSKPSTIDEMVGRTRVLLSFAGPFMLYGTPVVEACAKHGTHYCDSTGEMPWVQSIMKTYHMDAVKSQALIVPMCGFDCIPSDLGVLYAIQKLRERGVTSVGMAKTYGSMAGGMSGGTLSTGILMESKFKHIVDDPFNLGGGPENQEHLQQALDFLKEPKLDEAVGWTAPFIMENLNTRVVRRSAADLSYRAAGKGGFRYSEASIAGSEARAKKMSMGAAPPEKRKQLIEQGKLPKPGDGPSFDVRRQSWFQTLVNAKADDGSGKQIWVSVSGGDCGYEDTSLMCCESALCLALEYPACPRQGGVFTPAVAMGSVLIERLDRAGIRFRTVGEGPIPGYKGMAIRSSM